jgi:hypothetical protein
MCHNMQTLPSFGKLRRACSHDGHPAQYAKTCPHSENLPSLYNILYANLALTNSNIHTLPLLCKPCPLHANPAFKRQLARGPSLLMQTLPFVCTPGHSVWNATGVHQPAGWLTDSTQISTLYMLLHHMHLAGCAFWKGTTC